MAKVKVFLSFEFDRDNHLYQRFRNESKQCSRHKIIDKSLNEPYHPDDKWLQKARAQIKQSDIVIVLIGQDTHNAPGVIREVTVAGQLYKPRFQIRPEGSTGGTVAGAREVIPWDWDIMNAKINELLELASE